MNTKHLVIAMTLFSAIGSVGAQQNAVTNHSGFFDVNLVGQATTNPPGKTREQVRAELKQAQDNGWTDSNAFVGGHPSTQPQSTVPGKTRAQVLAELKEAQEQGLADNLIFPDAPEAHLKSSGGVARSGSR